MLRTLVNGGQPLARAASLSIGSARTNVVSVTNNLSVENVGSGIFCLSLNRADGKNSFSRAMLTDFNSAVTALHGYKNARVLILRSTVDKVFCAGADLKERALMPIDEVEGFVESLRSSFSKLAGLPFPTIAAIEGVALGGGLELALACDIRIAGSGALLGLPETALAIIPGAGGTQRLPRVVGIMKAKELIFTAARLSSSEALQIGLVNRAVDAGSAYATAIDMAKKMAENGPIAMQMAKRAIDLGSQVDLASSMDIEKSCYHGVVHTADRVEGLKAFKEKRKPEYKGE